MDERMNGEAHAPLDLPRPVRTSRDPRPPVPPQPAWDSLPPQPAWDSPPPQPAWDSPPPQTAWDTAPQQAARGDSLPPQPGWETLPPRPAWDGAPGAHPAPATRRALSGRGDRRRSRPELTLGIDLAVVRRWAYLAMYAIVGLDLAASVGAAEGAPYFLTRFFDADDKINFPTGYKTTFLLAATLLCLLLTLLARRQDDPFARGWLLLTLVCAFAFTDETIWLHQALSTVLRTHLHTGGYLAYAWTIVYLPGALGVAVILLRYLPYLDPVGRLPLLTGGAVYAFGAVAWEPIKSKISTVSGDDGLAFKLVACASDSMEMIGMTILVVTLLGYLVRRAGAVTFVLEPTP